jgi:UDP-N-acetylglucosamine:LPS N-acetylglucosamine transferase
MMGLDISKKYILVSFGGQNNKNIEKIFSKSKNVPNDWVLLVMSNHIKSNQINKENIKLMNDEILEKFKLGFQDLINASDIVLSKPSGAIVSESIIHSKSFLYIKREGFEEEKYLISALKENVSSMEITENELLNLDKSFFEKSKSVYPNKKIRINEINGEKTVCDYIINYQ